MIRITTNRNKYIEFASLDELLTSGLKFQIPTDDMKASRKRPNKYVPAITHMVIVNETITLSSVVCSWLYWSNVTVVNSTVNKLSGVGAKITIRDSTLNDLVIHGNNMELSEFDNVTLNRCAMDTAPAQHQTVYNNSVTIRWRGVVANGTFLFGDGVKTAEFFDCKITSVSDTNSRRSSMSIRDGTAICMENTKLYKFRRCYINGQNSAVNIIDGCFIDASKISLRTPNISNSELHCDNLLIPYQSPGLVCGCRITIHATFESRFEVSPRIDFTDSALYFVNPDEDIDWYVRFSFPASKLFMALQMTPSVLDYGDNADRYIQSIIGVVPFLTPVIKSLQDDGTPIQDIIQRIPILSKFVKLFDKEAKTDE